MVIDTILDALESDAEREAGLRFVELVAAYMTGTRDASGPVSTPLMPAEIAPRFEEPMPADGRPLAEVVARVERDIMRDANRLMHPMYVGHQVCGPLPVAVWMESLIAALNQSIAVSEMSPTGTPLETQLIRWMCDLAGLGPRAGGTFTSGGTEATFTGLLAARAAAMPDAWEEGVGDHAPVLLCGEHAHYAVTRAVAQLGLGMKRVVVVPSRDYRMDASVLSARLEELDRAQTRVMAVVATAGSTSTGSFDDLETIGRLCEARGVWLHVDGAHGASALLSAGHRHRLRGIERARSIAWDAHKMMLLPLPAGMLLVRDEGELEAAFAQRAPYLFHGSDGERVWDQGTRSFMCSRRADALKVWVALQRYGATGLGALYDHLCATTRVLWEKIGERADFRVLHEPESNILCFHWVGNGELDTAALDVVNRDVRERYNRSGRGWITTTILGGRRVLRVTIMNPRTRIEHLDALLDNLAEEGAQSALRMAASRS
ncbi:MAG TPA: aminotransferase class V-fold PLP-dependent enzyme [Gemmatimonadaceae bacterium]|nr:aminotransferase class V-fold PLP-dependent enzyme [Gemmatimonadaceae bacterium]